MSDWVGLGRRVSFKQGDATNLPFANKQFDAAMTIHVAMNIAAKDKMYAEARRVVKPGGVFAVYDVLQGEGGEVLYPVPWARDPSISHLATPDRMKSLLVGAGFKLLDVQDSTDESQSFFEGMTAQMAQTGSPPWRGGCSLVKIFRNGTQSSSQRDRTSDQDRRLYLRRVTAPEPTRVNEWLMSVSGTFETCRDVRSSVAIGEIADMARTARFGRD